MKREKKLLRINYLVFLFLVWLSIPGVSAAQTTNENKAKPGEFVVEPPTLINLGFEWYIEGDDNRNAVVEVQYRKKGAAAWKKGLPLLRLSPNERTVWWSVDYTPPNMFAGSIFDLEPDTEYECTFTLSDPDGVVGDKARTVTVRTRPEPKPYPGGRVYHLYPPDYQGEKQAPNCSNLWTCYYTGGGGGDWSETYPPRVQPGDTILVHAGIYETKPSPYPGLSPFDGTYYLTVSGTPEKPIAIKAAGDGEVIFDGAGKFNLFNVEAANYNYFEGLTIRNTDVAFLAGHKWVTGSSGLTVKRCRFENIGIGVWTSYSGSKNFYIADNVMIGRDDPNRLVGYTGTPWEKLPGYPPPLVSYFGVKVYGSGHVIAHNRVANFFDGLCHDTYGMPDGYPKVPRDRMPVSIDFYNNDITNAHDNCIEADGAMHNVRVMRNRCVNLGLEPLSGQPIFGGPAYFIRNIVYHAPGGSGGGAVPKEGGAFKNQFSEPEGLVILHNTLLTETALTVAPMPPAYPKYSGWLNTHFLNNLVLGEGVHPQIFQMRTYTNYSTSDYNGFRPNPEAEYAFTWVSPPFNLPYGTHEDPQWVVRNFKDLAEYCRVTGKDCHSRLVDWDIFENLAPPDRKDPQRIYSPGSLQFQLKPVSSAIDAGCILPNVNDDFAGGAPDLGALEVGRPLPVYGPRP